MKLQRKHCDKNFAKTIEPIFDDGLQKPISTHDIGTSFLLFY